MGKLVFLLISICLNVFLYAQEKDDDAPNSNEPEDTLPTPEKPSKTTTSPIESPNLSAPFPATLNDAILQCKQNIEVQKTIFESKKLILAGNDKIRFQFNIEAAELALKYLEKSAAEKRVYIYAFKKCKACVIDCDHLIKRTEVLQGGTPSVIP